jgi:hypothetical protein
MGQPLRLQLSPEQRQELEDMRDHAPIPYLRERAAAVLKVGDGMSMHRVAVQGLLRARDSDSVRGWVHRYIEEGIAGLYIRPGRGRKPASPPLQA